MGPTDVAAFPAGVVVWAVVAATRAAAWAEQAWSGSIGPKAPAVLDCTYDDGWNQLRTVLQQRIDGKWQLDLDTFHLADELIGRHIIAFLDFHQSKSNEFFHDCDRDEPEGKICLYGMLTAFVIHHVYLRYQIETNPDLVSESDLSMFHDSTNMARLMLINKNNCLDFFDSSGWPLSLEKLILILRPPDVQPFEPPPAMAPAVTHRLWPPPTTLNGARDLRDRRIVVYITGTHAALAREPAEMLPRFAGPLLGCEVVPVLEIADSFHCQFLGCDQETELDSELGSGSVSGAGSEASTTPSVRIADVGLRKLADSHFRPRWTGLVIEDLPEMRRRFASLFGANPLSREVDVFVCTSPVVLCTLLLPFGRPLIAYLGEPILLSVPKDEVGDWWETFEAMVTAPGAFFSCYNTFLSEMIRFQTGLSLPVVRLHGLYTGARYSATNPQEVLVVKGPNICLDPSCLLNRFAASAANGSEHRFAADMRFVSMDEASDGMSYARLASFRASVFYPYDVALALFYELYSMGVPLLVPRVALLRFFVFRGLHSDSTYHRVRPGLEPWDVPTPFIANMDQQQWFRASVYWSGLTDFATFPHLLRFGSVAELFAALQPGATEWSAVSIRMRRFNEEQLVVSAAQWAAAVSGAV